MKRKLLYILTAAGAAILALASFAAWLLATEAGARFSLAAVSRLSPLDLSAEAVRGRLAGPLALAGVEASWPGGQARVEELRLAWQPRELLRWHLQVEELSLRGVRFRQAGRDEEPASDAPVDYAFPRPERIPSLSARVENLLVEDLVLQREGETERVVQRFSARLGWDRPAVAVEQFRLVMPELRLAGEARADFSAPSLEGEVTAERQGPAGPERASLELSLRPAAGERHLVGPVSLRVSGDRSGTVTGAATLDWTAERLALDPLRLSLPESAGEVRGRLVVSGGRPQFTVELAGETLDLQAWVDTPTELTGELRAAGTPDRFEGHLQVANRAGDWRDFRLSTPFHGSRAGIVLPEVEGNWLTGTLRGEAKAGWQEATEVSLRLRGEGLDPVRITSDWPGRINFELDGSAVFPTDSPLRAEVDGRLIDSRLRGQPLTGRVQAAMAGDDVRIDELSLQGEGVTLRAEGRLRERIDFRAQVTRLAALVPEARGQLQAQGWVRWRDRHLSGRLAADGSDLQVAGTKIARIRVEAAHSQAGAPFRVTAEAEGLHRGDLRLARAGLQAEGLVEAHTMSLSAAGPDLDLQAAARGGYETGTWSGTVTELAVREERLGRWQLAGPTDLRLSPAALRIEPFYLAGRAGGRLQGAADLLFEPLRGTAQAHWEQLDLALANPWLEAAALAGKTSGSADLEWLSEDRLALAARAEADGSVQAQGETIGFRRLAIDAGWDAGGLEGKVDLELAEGGALSGTFASGEPAAFRFPASGRGRLDWQDFNLGLLAPWIPDLQMTGGSSGRLQGEWAGGGEQLTLAGEIEAAGDLRYRELALRIERAAVDLDWNADGLQAEWQVRTAEGSGLRGTLASAAPARLAVPQAGTLRAEWDRLDLALLSPLLPEGSVAGLSSGRLNGSWRDGGERFDLEAAIEAAGRFQREELRLEVRRARAEAAWNEKGLKGDWQIGLADGGQLEGTLASAAPGRLAVPPGGRLSARWHGIDLALVRPWMPGQMLLEGKLAGRLDGEWRDGDRLDLTGEAAIRGGELQWEGEEGVITAALQEAGIDWRWRHDTLEGELSLSLQEYGRARGRFALPLPARIPTAMTGDGPLRVELAGALKEEGLLTALLPGLVQETSGRLSFDLRVGGTWQAPELGGEARLAEAGAYLPAAGVRLQEVSVQARLQGEEVRLESFGARSGPGRIEGSGRLLLQNWRLREYTGRITGKRFQVVDLPELQLLVSPDLQIEGNREKLAVRGEVLLPEVLVRERQGAPPIAPSEDVVIVDAEAPPPAEASEFPLALDVRVRIVLGEHVLVKAEGLDARLEGSVRVAMTGLDPDEITAQGEIRVAQGHFSTYGVRLKIERGTVLFAGGPIDRPTLDILALRSAGEVKAGVRVTGTPRQPEVKLYSEPVMPDSEVLAYMILGHPVGQGEGNVNLLMTAAGALLTQGESAVLQDRVKRLLGLDVLELEAGNGDVTGSQITLGKYLNPDLYISFGQSLFTEANVVRLRYNLSERWQLESSVGDESAVDLYYKIEFK